MKKSDAYISKYICVHCHAPVIIALNMDTYKDSKEFDYWYYCANKGCRNHDGKGVNQFEPKWCQFEPEWCVEEI